MASICLEAIFLVSFEAQARVAQWLEHRIHIPAVVSSNLTPGTTIMERPSKLILFCGLPGSGKTTEARKLEQETHAVRLSPDEWMTDLGVNLFDEEFRAKMEVRLWKFAQELLRSGHDVILENGLWTRSERDAKRRDAQALNIVTEMHYLDVPLEELIRRLEIRNISGDYGIVSVEREEIEGYFQKFEVPDEAELALFDKLVVHKPDSE